MIRRMKNLLSILMSFVVMFVLCVPAFAAEIPVTQKNNASLTTNVNEYSVKEVKQLEPYVDIINKHYYLNTEAALAVGLDSKLVYTQKQVFDYLNGEVDNGNIAIQENMDFIVLLPDSNISSNTNVKSASHWSSCGGGRNTASTNHWWGYSRYACDCETQRMSADFNSCASVAAGVGVVGAYFGPVGALPGGLTSAYWWLLASRLDANNHGKGVYIEMTWVLAFDITPQ